MLAAACVAGAVILVSLAVFVTVRNSLYAQVDDNLQQRAANVLHSPIVSFPQSGEQIPAALLASSDVRFDIIDSDGDSYFHLRDGQRPPVGAAEQRVAEDNGPADSMRTDNRSDSRVYAVRYQQQGAALVLAESLAPTRATLDRLGVVLILVSAGGVLVAALGGGLIARGTLRPVQRLTEATERVARTGELRPIPVAGDDELARLTQSFNAMLGALADSREQQRRLVADAGHELRTPLTSLRTNLELLIASRKPGAPTLSEQDTADLYADVRGQLDELTTLIGDLVELARQDAPQVVHEPVELVDVVERALDRARRRATNVRFTVDLRPWTLNGDSNALERAVLNMLDNAVKFSPSGGVVSVVLRPLGDGTAVVEVTDQGVGIADADLPHVFERFYRSTEARTLPGSGLGLAIVMQAAQRHGGMAYAGRAPGGGALVTLRLPGSPA